MAQYLLSVHTVEGEAVTAYERAAALAPTDAERAFFRLGGRGSR